MWRTRTVFTLAFLLSSIALDEAAAFDCRATMRAFGRGAVATLGAIRDTVIPPRLSLDERRALRDADQELSRYSTKLTGKDYRALVATRMDHFFPPEYAPQTPRDGGDLASAVGALKASAGEKKRIAAFYDEMEVLLDNVPVYMGDLHRMKEFRKWWREKRDTILPPALGELKSANTSLGQLALALHMEYMEGAEKPRLSERLKGLVRPSTLINPPKQVAKWAYRFMMGLLVLGPGVQIANSFLGPVVNPIAQTAAQRGALDLQPAAEWIQGILSDHDNLAKAKESLARAKEDKDELDELVASMDSLPPEELQRRWADLQKGFFAFYQRYNQELPAHLRDGRNFTKDFVTNQLVWTAGSLSSFDVQYEIHKTKFDALAAIGAARALTPEEEFDKKRHAEQMEAAQSRIAAALASWKLFEIMYTEYTVIPEDERNKAPLTNIYQVFNSSLRYDLYQKEFGKQMRDELARIGVKLGRYEAEVRTAEAKAKAKN